MSLFREEMQVKFEEYLKILLSEYISDVFLHLWKQTGKKETKKLYFVEARPQI